MTLLLVVFMVCFWYLWDAALVPNFMLPHSCRWVREAVRSWFVGQLMLCTTYIRGQQLSIVIWKGRTYLMLGHSIIIQSKF